MDPGTTPAAVKPLKDSIDVFCDTLTFGSDLAIRINGNTPDAAYDRLYVNGVIDLSGVELILSGTYTPIQGDSFVIVMNDGVEAILDTFVGLSEGDTLFNFLGDTLEAVITYSGNTGNDVVIRIPVICFMPDIPVLETTTDTICQQSSVELSILSGNLGSATDWHWYSDACGGDSIGIGSSIVVTPSETTTYYVRGEGGCVTASACAMAEIVVNPLPTAGIEITFS